ncbi:MAG: hypothetical protein HY326_06525 [Chloroflexi bacterium]|nr:hypothetical protein [Chloroflexota bacterium]
MSKELTHVPFDEFVTNLLDLFDRVVHEHETVIVEREDGTRAILKSVRARKLRRRQKTEADYEAFRSSAGGWKDVDTDKLIEDIYANRRLADRRISNRPPVEL